MLLFIALVHVFPGACDVGEADRKIAYLHTLLVEEQHATHVWSWTWGTIYSTGAALQLALLPAVDSETRKDFAIGGASAALGASTLFGLPLRITRPISEFRRHVHDADRCAVLVHAEQVLYDTARAQKLAQSWVGHVGNAVFNIAMTMILGLGFGHWQGALISGGIGIVIGELNLLTQPARLPRVAIEYERGAWRQ